MNLLSVSKLSKSFGDKKLFEQISFGINQGDKLALIAKNGSGKSTLFKILKGIEIPDEGEAVFRKGIKVEFLNQDQKFDTNQTIIDFIADTDNLAIKTAIAYEQIFELHAQNPSSKTENKIEELTNHMTDYNAWDTMGQIQLVCANLGLTDFNQHTNTLSGGQQKRLALAKVILNEPDLLVMDEPTNHLDVKAIEWLEDYLTTYKKSILLVTHDRYFLDAVCNKIIEIDAYNLFEYNGHFDYYLEKKAERLFNQASEHEKTKNLYRRELEWVRKQPKARTTKSKSRVDAFYDTEAKARSIKTEKKTELSVKVERIGSKIIELHQLSKKYDTLNILNPFSYTFIKGEKIGIVGPNGVGKTTFINLIQQLEQPTTGKVVIGDTIVIGYYSQQGIKVADDKRVIEVVKDIAEFIPLANGTQLSASALLTRFNFPPEVQYGHVSKLSGGERRRLYLLTVLVKNPNFLILDEPTNDLDIVTLQTLEEFLVEFQGCVLIVSHDRYFLDRLVSHIFAFEGNGVVKDFPGNYTEYRQYLDDKEVVEAAQQKNQIATTTPINSNDIQPSIEKDTRKKTYKEEQEIILLEKELSILENQKQQLENEFANNLIASSDIAPKSIELNKIIEDIEQKTNRWLELQVD